MAHGSEAARDLRYGRRGGRWVTSGQGPTTGPPCSVCGGVMLDGQDDHHRACVVDGPLRLDADTEQLGFDL